MNRESWIKWMLNSPVIITDQNSEWYGHVGSIIAHKSNREYLMVYFPSKSRIGRFSKDQIRDIEVEEAK